MTPDALLLHIETSTEVCSIAISKGPHLLSNEQERQGRKHAQWLPLMIESARQKASVGLKDLDAVCYSRGPGSYTGLRVGLSTAKGLCFGLAKPLIGVPTLLAMAHSGGEPGPFSLFVPMIDARRDEVYMAVYGPGWQVIAGPESLVLSPGSLDEWLEKGYSVHLFGDGSVKAKTILKPHERLNFGPAEADARYMIKPGLDQFNLSRFENLAYAVPEYLKVPNYKKTLINT
ncbi:MAG TPA: tRNA (adenosine(37)-N6)-threonylcarbamoyltransferase complex dimerization subunit type 1 TsaB [Saprospiraceae bacterium]|nr:tRNA (adenosine(37)-N6)-threonylcarbamoyltransferase complex dimerization subunit type 1 TsaB [Saprospiraceae bacterium]